jgi:hypothetical protein
LNNSNWDLGVAVSVYYNDLDNGWVHDELDDDQIKVDGGRREEEKGGVNDRQYDAEENIYSEMSVDDLSPGREELESEVCGGKRKKTTKKKANKKSKVGGGRWSPAPGLVGGGSEVSSE